MKKFAKVNPCSKTNPSMAEIIANNDVVETEVVNDYIGEGIDVTRSLFDNEKKLLSDNLEENIHAARALIETSKSIRTVELLKKECNSDCYCCNRYDEMKDYSIKFLKCLMEHDIQKFKEIGQFFTNLEEERQKTCENKE